jgi:AcrR family transcriptional regulator
MQRPDEKKRREILQAAVKLFATRQFHEVRLDDVAHAAQVGKGTLYVYFKSKEDLYATIIREGLDRLVERVAEHAKPNGRDQWCVLKAVIGEIVDFAMSYPHFFTLMRSGNPAPRDPVRRARRSELARIVESVIRRGVDAGEFNDPRPDLTAQLVPSLVRSLMIFGPTALTREDLTNHLVHLLSNGIRKQVTK